jgi:hypothetical protein
MDNKLCPHCGCELETDREKNVGVCYVCRRHGLLTGHWPELASKGDVDKHPKIKPTRIAAMMMLLRLLQRAG